MRDAGRGPRSSSTASTSPRSTSRRTSAYDAGRHHRQGHADPGALHCRHPLARRATGRYPGYGYRVDRRRQGRACSEGTTPEMPMTRPPPPPPSEVPGLQAVQYDTEIRAALKETLGLAQRHAGAPRSRRSSSNMGVGRPLQPGVAPRGARSRTSPRSPARSRCVTKAKKSIAGFKLREGKPIGAKVTLRGARDVGVPRPADQPSPSPASATSAASTSDGVRRRGNYTFGVHRAADLPGDRLRQGRCPRGMDITIVTTARQRRPRHAEPSLDAFGFPFRREGAEARWPRRR